MRALKSIGQDKANRLAILLVLSVFLQSLFATHTHADSSDAAPSDAFRSCAVCMLGSIAGGDAALPSSPGILFAFAAGSCAPTLSAVSEDGSGPLKLSHRSRAPPAKSISAQ